MLTPKLATAFPILILSLASIGAPAGGPTAPFPPPPEMPSRKGMSDADYSAARDKWRDSYSKWEGSLTPEQILAHEDAEKKHRKADTSIERALQRRLPQPGDGYDWKTAAEKRRLVAPTISQLEKNQFAYGPSVKQSFEPYLDGPVYITSDSLLNAFHVLFEDSFRELELRNVDPLRAHLEQLLTNAKNVIATKKLPLNRMEAALRHAQRVLGPAILLLGGSLEDLDSALQAEITAQTETIREADSTGLPVWLGPPDPQTLLSLDYRRCKPVGFYAASEKLSGYFRAVRWLQMIPFRSGRTGEFDAAVLLNLAARQSRAEDWEVRQRELLGTPDDLTIEDIRTKYSLLLEKPLDEASYDKELSRLRITLTRYLVTQHHSAINFDLRARQTPLHTLANQLTFRVLSPTRLADAILFQNLIDQRQKPHGLAVAALLGSPFAQRQLADDEKKVVEKIRIQIATEKESGEWWSSQQIYANYLDTLNALFLPPAADAPTFMKTEAWEAKNCQTALGGWAQMRHTFTLQAKTNVTFFGLVMVPPGFVEDNPEFFARMARLVDKCHDLFANNECFDPRKPDESEKTTDEGKVIMGEANEPSLRARWLLLGRIAHSLESLAHKQSRRQPWTESEETFLHTYGDEIAYVMGYFGNSWLAPHDDAPRWAEVNRDPAREKSLVAAIGRPRTLYVLYPWNGIQVLCTGSVMQYYEYESTQRLTDPEWLQLLDSPQAPSLPSWLGKEVTPPGSPQPKRRR